MKKYKVKLTFIEEVEATNEQDAIIIAYDGVVASGYNDVEVDEIKESEEVWLYLENQFIEDTQKALQSLA